MKIYTKTGDLGETALYGGERRSKDDIRIEAYGSVDELQAQLGLVSALLPKNLNYLDELITIQRDLFAVCSELATSGVSKLLLDPDASARLEQWIDEHSEKLPALRKFILQGGSPVGATLHLARAVSRRAERRVVALAAVENVRAEVIVYLNRLSDYLFTLARRANQEMGIGEQEL